MSLKVANNATTILSAATTAAATTLIVVNTTRFPTLLGGDWTYATLVSLTAGFDSFGNPNSFEIVKINGPFTPGATSLSVTRAQDGTSGLAFSPGDVVDLRINRLTLLEAAAAGAVNSVAADDASLVVNPTTGAVLAHLNVANANTWTADQRRLGALASWVAETNSTSSALTGVGAYFAAFNTAGNVAGFGATTTAYSNPGTPLLASQAQVQGFMAGGTAVGAWLGNVAFWTANGTGIPREAFSILNTGTTRFAAGSATAGTAPIKLTSGPLMGTAEVGALEFLTDKAYFTITTAAARRELALTDVALTSGRSVFVTTNGRLLDSANYAWDNANARLNLGGAPSTVGNDIYLQKSSTGQVGAFVQNTNTGAAAFSVIGAYNNAIGIDIITTSSGFTPAGLILANQSRLAAAGAGGLFINTGAAPIVLATGGTAAANERFAIDSNGNVTVNNAALATNATNGFLYIPTSPGPPTGAATAKTGRAPIEIDDTNNVFYFRAGGAWRPVPSITYPGNTTTWLRGDGAFSSTLTGSISTAGLTTTGSVVMSGDIQITTLRRITWDWLNDGSSGATKTIDWSSYLKHKLQATANCVVSFTAPATTDAELALVVQGDGSLRSFTWPGTVVWENASVPTMPTATDDFLEVRGRYSSTGPVYYLTWGRFGY